MDWSALFDRAAAFDIDETDVRESLTARRGAADDDCGKDDSGKDDSGKDDSGKDDSGKDDSGTDEPTEPPAPSPARVVADADVLAADLLAAGPSRDALDALRRHSWTTLVASDTLLNDTEAVITDLADAELAGAWRERVEQWREPVLHPAEDHPALGSAYRGGAMHVLSFDDRLTSAAAGAGLTKRVPVSVREPRAFATVFDAARLYPEIVGAGPDEYPGPDRDPRE